MATRSSFVKKYGASPKVHSDFLNELFGPINIKKQLLTQT